MLQVTDFVALVTWLAAFLIGDPLRRWIKPEDVGVERVYPTDDTLKVQLVAEEHHIRVNVMRRSIRAGSDVRDEVLLGIYRLEYTMLQFLAMAAEQVAQEYGYTASLTWSSDRWDIHFSPDSGWDVYAMRGDTPTLLERDGRRYVVPGEPIVVESGLAPGQIV